jgi:mRNA-degrading endonuclease RelE of RelBE toxin-antitoxin system
MRPNPLAPWELRIGKFRAYYDVDVKNALVEIVAVGVKWHSKVFVGGLETDL